MKATDILGRVEQQLIFLHFPALRIQATYTVLAQPTWIIRTRTLFFKVVHLMFNNIMITGSDSPRGFLNIKLIYQPWLISQEKLQNSLTAWPTH